MPYEYNMVCLSPIFSNSFIREKMVFTIRIHAHFPLNSFSCLHLLILNMCTNILNACTTGILSKIFLSFIHCMHIMYKFEPIVNNRINLLKKCLYRRNEKIAYQNVVWVELDFIDDTLLIRSNHLCNQFLFFFFDSTLSRHCVLKGNKFPTIICQLTALVLCYR